MWHAAEALLGRMGLRLGVVLGWKHKAERRAFVRPRLLQPDPAAVLLGDALADGQSHPASGILLCAM
jgi:hypothetical protein